MTRLRVLGLDRVDECASLLRSVRPGECRNKAGALDLNSWVRSVPEASVRRTGHEASLGRVPSSQSVTRIAGAPARAICHTTRKQPWQSTGVVAVRPRGAPEP